MNKITPTIELDEAGSRYCVMCRFLVYERRRGWICVIYKKRPLSNARGYLRLRQCLEDATK